MNSGRTGLIPMGSKELKPDKISKKSVGWNKTFRMNEEGNANESGTTDLQGVEDVSRETLLWYLCGLKRIWISQESIVLVEAVTRSSSVYRSGPCY
jgi:hypothetical protein